MDNLSNKTNNESATCKKMGKVLLFLAFIMGTIVCGVASSNTGMVHALTYQNNVPVEFTFNPTLSINLSSADLIISDLSPGSSSDSNIITVSVSTNNAYGYYLSATVGSKGGTTALTNPNTSATFTNLATTAGAASTLSNIPDNYWGYSYSIDNGTSWISGDIDSSASGYAGLPLDNNDNANEKGKGGVALQNTTDPTGVTPIKFKIGAKASVSQPSGEYTNTINFYAVTNPEPPKEYLQGYTTAQCAADASSVDKTLYDKRDNNSYTVRYIGNKCWMTKNLAFDGNTLESSTSNVPSAYTTSNPLTITWYDLSSNGDFSEKCSMDNGGYDNACKNIQGDQGAWYNFAGASAGTITGGDSSSATYSICPAGWKLPSTSDMSIMYNASNFASFSPIFGGAFFDGSLENTQSEGYWWASDAEGNIYRDALANINGSAAYYGDGDSYGYYGYYVRCVAGN